MNEQIILEVKFNDKLQSIFLDDYRIGGCKWNDIDNGKTIKLYIKKQDLLHALKLETEQAKRKVVKEFADKVKSELEKYRLENEEETDKGWILNSSQFCVDVDCKDGLIDELAEKFISEN